MPSSQGADAGKSSLRSGYLDLCRRMPKDFAQRIDLSVRQMVTTLDLYREADLVLFYLPIHEEIDTFPLMEDALAAGKRIALPVFNAKEATLDFYEVESLDQITRGSRGLAKPPTADAKPFGTVDLLGSVCFVPGLVFDAEGYRVGYGAGYYDEYLAYYPGDKIGLVRSVQVSSNPLPHDNHDIPVDVLVTEGTIWRCRKIFQT